MEVESDNMHLCEPTVVQSSLSNLKYMVDHPKEHEPVYHVHMETSYASCGIK